MKGTKNLSLLLIVMLCITMLTACNRGGNDTTKDNVVMNVAILGDPARIDPAFAYDNDTSVIIDNITEGLLTHNEDNSLKPCLATSFEALDELTYVYKIRSDVYFSDGKKMTVDDVVYSLNRHMDESLGSLMNWFFANVESIEATGDWEVTVKLSNPEATWQYVLATSAGMIIEKEYAEAHRDNLGSAEVGIIGTGPFVFDSWTNGAKVILKKNENYWNKESKTNIDEIDFNVISDDTTLATALKSGQIDFSVNYSDKLLETFRSYQNVTVTESPGMGIHYLAFNTARKPFDDINVRKAIGYAIDLDSIFDNIIRDHGYKGGLLPMTDSLFTISSDKWKEYIKKIGGHEYNLDKAKEYMSKSKVPDGFSFTLLVSEAASQRYDVALVIQESLKALNIDVTVQKVTSDEFYTYQFGNVLDAYGVRDYDALVATWGADYPDPSANLTPLYTISNIAAGGYNCASYSNEAVDKLLTDSAKIADNDERMELLFKACDQIVEDQPYYIYNYTKVFGVISNNYDYGDMNIGSAWDWNFKNMVFKE